MKNKLKEFLTDQRGTTVIEYSLLVGGIGIGVATGSYLVGDTLVEMMKNADMFAGMSFGGSVQ
ncbi:MAG: Flp family type IVb pilin [Alphaproteobacteria bacterium]